MASVLSVGSTAPDFSAKILFPPQTTKEETLNELLEGKKSLVVYFYPKDDTPGCTTEACNFRDMNKDFEALGSGIIGISPDTIESHIKFAENHKLPFPLIADPDHAIAESFGAWAEKKNYGRVYMGIVRSTYVLNGDGEVIKIYPSVKVDLHAEKVLEFVKGL
jgi:peroxiredoxin Q/BCP